MKYPNTNIDCEIGDIVKFIEDNTNMVVVDVINTKEKKRKWGLEENEENVVMLEGEKYGLMTDFLDNNSEIVFIKRKNNKNT